MIDEGQAVCAVLAVILGLGALAVVLCVLGLLRHRVFMFFRGPYTGLKPRPVAEAVGGRFAVEGTVLPADAGGVTSPLSGRQAVGYTVRVRASCLDDDQITWDRSVQQVGAFLLQDDAGDRILVRGADARIVLRRTAVPRATEDLTGCAPAPLHAAFCRQHGSDELLDRTIARGGERLLRAGDRVRVYGEVTWLADGSMPDPGLRGGPRRCLDAPKDDPDTPLRIIPLSGT